jgi:hypothetical protein
MEEYGLGTIGVSSLEKLVQSKKALSVRMARNP